MDKFPDTEYSKSNYAFLFDRVRCNLNYKQRFGTQVNWTNNGEASGFRTIEKEHVVNSRRAKFKMEPLELYSLSYGFTYQPVSRLEQKAQDALLRRMVRGLIDSANYNFEAGNFVKAYDAYNSASTFAGEMNAVDNFKAAVLFARIAAVDADPRYKSISLDFLHLLHLQGTLNKRKLLRKSEFKVLYPENRWKRLFD